MNINLVNFESLYADLKENDFYEWQEALPQQLTVVFEKRQHGKKEEWQTILQQLPEIQASSIDIAADKVRIGTEQDCDQATGEQLFALLKKLHPWRKGPYELFGIDIDTEWHSDWKWQRIKSHNAVKESSGARCGLWQWLSHVANVG